MSTEIFELIENDKNNIEDLACLLEKNILDISLDGLKQIEKIAIFKNNVTVQEVKKIENMLFENGVTWDNSIVPLFVMSIVGYYLDNNFYTDLKVFINKLKVPSLAELITKIEDYINSFKNNELLYLILVNRFQSLFTYYQIYQKESLVISKDIDKVILLSDNRLTKTLDFLSNLSKFGNSDEKFRAMNSIYSYTNYEVPFLLLDLNSDRKYKIKDYVSYFKKFISEISDDIVENTSNVAKIVFLNNFKFIYDIADCLKFGEDLSTHLETDFIRYISLLDYDKDTNGFKAFSRDYSGLDLESNNMFSSDSVCYSSLLSLDTKGLDVISIAGVLSDYSLNQTIRRYSKVFFDTSLYKFVDKDNVVLVMENILTTSNSYFDKVFFDLLARSNDISLSTYEIFLKEVGIKLFGIETNYNNLYVELEINNKQEEIKDRGDISELNLILDIEEQIGDNNVKLRYFVSNAIAIDKKKIYSRYLLNNEKVKKILKNMVKNRLTTEKFFYDINLKISKLKDGADAHPETLEHMESLGKLLCLLLKDNHMKDEYDILSKVADRLFVDVDTFLRYIGYLHDIGKVDNIHKLNESKTINSRNYMPVGVYYFISNVLGITTDFSHHDFKTPSNVKKLDIKVSNMETVNNLIKAFYRMLGTKNISHLIFSDYFKFGFLDLVKKVSSYISNDYEILNNDKKPELQKLLDKLGIDIDIDKFFVSLIYILDQLSNLTYEEVSSPHITYGMHFFSFHREFDYLSWVLFHHNKYPIIEEVKYYEIENGLKKWADIIGYDYNKYFENVNDNMPISASNKDIYMVILTFSDIIDALLSRRSYQEVDEPTIMVFSSLLKEVFVPEVADILVYKLKGEEFSSPEEVFDKKILPIMDNEFKDNPFYPKVKKVVLKHKDEIIAMYKPLRNKD